MRQQKISKNKRMQSQLIRFVLLVFLFVAGTFLFMRMLERVLLNQVQAVTESASVAFTRVFVNEAWSEIETKLDMTGKVAPQNNPQLRDVDMRIRHFAKGTDLIKVKIYNLQGLTVYSSDPAQLGENKSGNAGFQTATRGRAASETTYRGKFGAFDGDLYQRNLISSYVPVRGPQGIEAVVEIYADRTSSIDAVEKTIRETWLLFGFSSFVVFMLVWFLTQSGRRQLPITPSDTGSSDVSDSNLASNLALPQSLIDRAISNIKDGKDQLLKQLASGSHDFTAAKASKTVREFADASLHTLEEINLILNPRHQKIRSSVGSMSIAKTVEALNGETTSLLSSHGIELICEVAPSLASRVFKSSEQVHELLLLLIKDAASRTGQGHLRLNLQPHLNHSVFIELICTRTPSMTEPVYARVPDSITLKAAQSLAQEINVSILKTTFGSQGPWITAVATLEP